MEKIELGTSRDVLAKEDLHHLVQRGRALHDQAVFQVLAGLVGKVRSFLKTCVSASASSDQEEYSDRKGASLR